MNSLRLHRLKVGRVRVPRWFWWFRKKKWHKYWRSTTRRKWQKSRRYIGRVRRNVFRRPRAAVFFSRFVAKVRQSPFSNIRNTASGSWWHRSDVWPARKRRKRRSKFYGYRTYGRDIYFRTKAFGFFLTTKTFLSFKGEFKKGILRHLDDKFEEQSMFWLRDGLIQEYGDVLTYLPGHLPGIGFIKPAWVQWDRYKFTSPLKSARTLHDFLEEDIRFLINEDLLV